MLHQNGIKNQGYLKRNFTANSTDCKQVRTAN